MSSQLRVDSILPSAGTALGIGTASGSITFNSSNISGDVIFNDDVTVNGVLTYEDVTNIDSVGIVTARSDIYLGNDIYLTDGSSGYERVEVDQNDLRVTGKHIHSQFGVWTGSSSVNNRRNGISGDNNDLRLYSNSTEKVRITSAGRIGINQTSPEAMLQVDYDYASSEVGLRLRAASGSGTKTWQLSEINGNAGVFTIRNATNSQDILNIDGVNQRIGVNDTTPDATLSVGGSTAFIDVGEAGGNRGKIGYSSNDLYFGTSSSSGAFIFKTNVTSTDNPASSGTDRIRIDSNGRQYHYTDGSLRMHLNATGLGVNTYTITGGRLIHAHNTGTGSAYFQSTNSNTGEGANSGALFGVSGTTCYAPWNYINGPVVFATNASEKMRIHATGEVTKSSQPLAIIGTTQNNWSPSAGDALPFNYNNTNRGNHYNTSNYTFTCPVAGDYMVILRLSRKGWCGDLELAKNNSQYVRLELRETGRNDKNAADWQAWCYDFIVPCAANDTLKWKAANVYTGTGGGNYLLDGYNHIYYDSVTYYLMG